MDVTQKAREVVASAVGAAAKVLPGSRPGAQPARQTLTVGRPAADVLAAWRDPQVVSRLLGDLGRAEAGAPGRWTFSLTAGGASVEAELTDGPDVVEFHRPGEQGPDGALLRVGTRPAPRELGTEVTCEVASELSAGVGAVPFTLLYRLRALLLTGEIPTLGPQPAAREEER
ncbi:hypothetical protein [Kineococcus arenarius]|uniref:hypothetical protein n=1 Tax=unclassified Kineococcus TaxID=2621656 RepID=UPI003D7D668A